MVAALAATLARPAWWSMALAAFLVRGGILLVLLPILTLPSAAELATTLSPTVSALAFGGLTAGVVVAIVLALAAVLALLAAVGLTGAWLDRAQLREAATDEELELGWWPAQASLGDALALRLTAHLPTLAALAYATFRLIGAAYDELLSPGDVAVPMFLRIAERAPDALLAVGVTWLAGEAVGALAARRAGAGFRAALSRSARQVASRRGLATLLVTTAAVVAVLVPFLIAAARSWGHLRDVLLDGGHPVLVAAALLVLVATWILGLASAGAVLAWRTAAWTAEVAPARRSPAGPAAPRLFDNIEPAAGTVAQPEVPEPDRHATGTPGVRTRMLGPNRPLL